MTKESNADRKNTAPQVIASWIATISALVIGLFMWSKADPCKQHGIQGGIPMEQQDYDCM